MTWGPLHPVTGKPRYDNEILSYNIMVRKLNGEDNESIFEIEKGKSKLISNDPIFLNSKIVNLFFINEEFVPGYISSQQIKSLLK